MRRLGLILVIVVVLGVSLFFLFKATRSDTKTSGENTVTSINEQTPGFPDPYTHRFVGAFSALDLGDLTLQLMGEDRRQYYFTVPQDVIDNNDSEVMNNVTGQLLEVKWNDKRSPEQVMEDYALHPDTALNNTSNIFKVTRISSNEE